MLEVRVTEAPDPLITVVYVTTDNIEVSATSEGWIYVIDEEITFELVDDFKVDKCLVGGQRQGFLFKPVIKLASRDPGEIGDETVELTDKHEKRIQSLDQYR